MTTPYSFARLVVTDYYDGETEGFADDGRDGPVYSFRMLDWDSEQNLRIFSLSQLPGESLPRIASALGHGQEPSWPVWVLSGGTKEQDEEDIKTIATLTESARLVAIVATADLRGEPLVQREVGPDDLLADVDWFAEFGLSRTGDER